MGGYARAKLSFADEVRIAARCEELWRAACRTKHDAVVGKMTRLVSKQWSNAKRFTADQQQKSRQLKAHGVPLKERLKRISANDDDYFAEVKIAIHKDHGTPDLPEDENDPRFKEIEKIYNSEPQRLIRVPRPKGAAAEIIEQVAREASKRHRFAIGERLVERLWHEYIRQ